MRSNIHFGKHATSILPAQSPICARMLFLPGLLYEGLIRSRNRLYDAGLLPQSRLPNPVISIGNLTVGGTGKTPLVAHIARAVCRMGVAPALLSRGYGRTAREPVILEPGDRCRPTVQLLGDEPALVRRHVPEIWLGISADRHAVGLKISERAARVVFILDDGFQHRRLQRDLDVVVIDRSQPLEHNRLMPGGTLREPLTGLRRADLLVLNGIQQDPVDDPIHALLRSINPESEVFHCTQHIEHMVLFDDWLEKGPGCSPCVDVPPVFLVAAIGNPERFRSDVLARGIGIKGARFYRDHFSPGPHDWSACVAEARACGAGALLTTEKDAIKLPRVLDFPLLVAVQSTQLAEQATLERIIRAMIEGRK
jgi:tetraacyldisaccharide 4'-kinase